MHLEDKELFKEICKAYQLAAPYIARTRFAIAYFNRRLQWSDGHVIDPETGELVIHVFSGYIMPELRGKNYESRYALV